MASAIAAAKKAAQAGKGAGELVRVRIMLKSLVPCLQDRVDPATIEGIEKGSSAKATKGATETREQIANKKLYRGPGGEFGFPTRNLYAALCGAGSLVKFNTRSNIASGSSGTKIPMFLRFENPMFIPFKTHSQMVIDVGTGRSMTGGMVVTIRPRFDEWTMEVIAVVDERFIDMNRVQTLFTLSGFQGLGTYRPGKSKTGFYGTYEVVEWEELSRQVPIGSLCTDDEAEEPDGETTAQPGTN